MDPAKLKVVELRSQLSQRGLDTKGNKAVLVERLRKALEEETENKSEETVPVSAENVDDTALKETSKKSVQPPRTPSRSSRSSSVTPTKINTRSTPKHATPASSKLSTPNKVQNVEKGKDILTTIPERIPEEHIATERDQKTPPPQKDNDEEDEEEDGQSTAVPAQEKGQIPTSEESKEELSEDGKEKEDNSLKDDHSDEINTSMQECVPPSEKSESKTEKMNEEEDTKIEKKEEAVDTKTPSEDVEQLDENNQNASKEEIQKDEEMMEDEEILKEEETLKDEEILKEEETLKDEEILKEEETLKDEEILKEEETLKDEEILKEEEMLKDEEMLNDEEIQKEEQIQKDLLKDETNLQLKDDFNDTDGDVEMKENVKVLDDVTEAGKNSVVRQPVSVTCENQKESETISLEHEEGSKVETSKIKMDDQEPSDTKEVTEDTFNNDVSISNQDVEMVEENTKEDGKDWNADQNDTRKRKRSPSPAEELPKSPLSPALENEPEIDNAVVVLSWYDSDLNLLIEKKDLLSATPMHSDGFCYIWAGARASHGYRNGKIYYEAKIIDHCSINIQDEEYSHVLRVGWSASHTSMQLGEDKLSYGYSATGKKCSENKFEDYGEQFNKDDIIGCYADMSQENDIVLFYTLNGKNLGTAFSIPKEELGDRALFPHVLSKNCTFACNFGQEKPWSEEIVEEYIAVGNVDQKDRTPGPRRPEKKEDCEVLMMCGLPAAGKTVWATKHAAQYPEKMYNILGISTLVDKMKNMGQPRKQNYHGRWEGLIEKCTRTLNKLLEMACSRRRNYILDQTNVHPSAQRRKMKNFCGFQRKAIVVVPTNEEFKSRTSKHEALDGKAVPDSVVMEMKANFSAPEIGESFDEVQWVELSKEEGKKLIEKYNKEGKEAGYGQQQSSKRPRFDRSESHKDNRDSRNNRDSRDSRDNRDNRDHRDHRDRRNNYSNRNRNSIWRGSNSMGSWTDRPVRGGHMRHGGGGYGPPRNWRGRGMPIAPPHRGGDRRGGSNDRRGGNDRNRSVSRQGGWGPASGYQGSQQSGWSQGNWSNSSQSQGWGQGWGQQQQSGSWKSYGQGSYSQCNYNQQGYGNGNWNQQYYNQYWDPQQSSGQTTAAGSQAVSTTSATESSSESSEVKYSHPQRWQGYTQTYSFPTQNATTDVQQSQQHK